MKTFQLLDGWIVFILRSPQLPAPQHAIPIVWKPYRRVLYWFLPTAAVQLVILSDTCCTVDSPVAQSNHLLLRWLIASSVVLQNVVFALLLIEGGGSGLRGLDTCSVLKIQSR